MLVKQGLGGQDKEIAEEYPSKQSCGQRWFPNPGAIRGCLSEVSLFRVEILAVLSQGAVQPSRCRCLRKLTASAREGAAYVHQVRSQFSDWSVGCDQHCSERGVCSPKLRLLPSRPTQGAAAEEYTFWQRKTSAELGKIRFFRPWSQAGGLLSFRRCFKRYVRLQSIQLRYYC